jgi:integrase
MPPKREAHSRLGRDSRAPNRQRQPQTRHRRKGSRANRTFASLLFAIGEPPPYVMSRMGHTTAGLTLSLYAREMNRRDGERDRLRALVQDAPRRTGGTTRSSTSTAAG